MKKKTDDVKIEYDGTYPEVEFLTCTVGKNTAIFSRSNKEDVWKLTKITDIEYLNQIVGNLSYYGIVPDVKLS